MHLRTILLPLALIVSTHAGTTAIAEKPVALSATDTWEFRAGMPGWISGLDGDAAVRGVSMPVDVPFGDIISRLDMGASLSFEARNGRWVFVSSLIYMNLSDAAGTPGPLFDSVSLELKQFLVDTAVSYAVIDHDNFRMEAMLGARYNAMDLNMTLESGLTSINRSGDQSWIDPYLGFRTRTRLNPSLDLVISGDIGGFNIGSDLTWQAYAGFEYQISKSTYASLGYRALSVDYSSGGFTYDVVTSGPQIEFGFKF